ncbi:beclin-1-like protein A isoform X2 [Aphidius gifuensis]|uniref:beclin-1-like protein A isoform X2 n=1 Tax=Aphidius gifuensis TaxID=684658 RepID=UPI001CDB56FC|nr:beclin-1-like protein A isoform X2 [Aphidius gifuensis]
MNRDSEEQRPIPQTLCGALQKEANCKCLVLSVLIYGCLAAVTWCRCAYVPKVFINYSKFPLRTTRHVSPCDDGYIYIPVAFMGMLYLVYLVECYHSPIRLDLHNGESQESVLTKLTQLRLVQPTIWWKAVSYHYVRRKRQVTRYRNGDNYTTTQVYYERVNTHAATSLYFYDYCGVKDISKNLTMDSNLPITKITLSKGFAFSNMRSATEFEEARSRFFAEQELRDDYMEMREGLDLGYNFNSSTSLVAVLGKPWFTNSYVYWLLSALLLSWPLRIIIECNTQYADYQITKLFGVNYDTPTSGDPIHASCGELSAPGSYMLAPSYSEALLMEPAGGNTAINQLNNNNNNNEMIVPSYSEALLYEHANGHQNNLQNIACTVGRSITNESIFAVVEAQSSNCDCPCHNKHNNNNNDDDNDNDHCISSRTIVEQSPDAISSLCNVCSSSSNLTNDYNHQQHHHRGGNSILLARDISEPNLKTNSADLMRGMSLQFLRKNGRSLENIMENDETTVNVCDEIFGERQMGAIPKNNYASRPNSLINSIGGMSRKKIPQSKTYLCLKAILKQNKRRYTLVTTDELKNYVANDNDDSIIHLRDNSSKQKQRETLNRTLIFASPIQEICRPNDAFVETKVTNNLPNDEEEEEAEPTTSSTNKHRIKYDRNQQQTHNVEPEYLQTFITNKGTQQNETRCLITTNVPCGGLTRSQTERRPKPPTKIDKTQRHSFTDERTQFGHAKRMNFNMETSL